MGRFATQNHHFSGEILHSLCIFNRKFETVGIYVAITVRREILQRQFQADVSAQKTTAQKFNKNVKSVHADISAQTTELKS